MAKKWAYGKIASWANQQQKLIRLLTHNEVRDNPYHGFCLLNEEKTQTIPGEKLFETHVASRLGNAGHVVKLVPLRGSKQGMVVDVSRSQWDAGRVSNVHDEDSIRNTLSQIFSVEGWQRRK